MSLFPKIPDGYYDEAGQWQRTKFCFVYCGVERCTCGAPGGQYYSETHDKRKQQDGQPDAAPPKVQE